MALHKKWRKTYFSTPSATSHQAYPFWSGEAFNKRHDKGEKVNIDVSHKRLLSGFTGEEKIWRQIVTIMDAAAGGRDLFDINELRDFEYLASAGPRHQPRSVWRAAVRERTAVGLAQ